MMNRYQGGKNGAGVYQTIINRIPAHHRYFEPFAGSAAIYRKKSPAASSILMERHSGQAEKLAMLASPSTSVICGDALREILSLLPTIGSGDFFYFDPPYVHEARKDPNLYLFELTDNQHRDLVESLLPAITAAGGLWMLSGYRNSIYAHASSLRDAWQHDFQAMTRRGPAIETLWMNYDPDASSIAETTYAGSCFRERERIKRKAARWADKFCALPRHEQASILASIDARCKGR